MLAEKAHALEGTGQCQIREDEPGQSGASLRRALAIYQRIGSPEH